MPSNTTYYYYRHHEYQNQHQHYSYRITAERHQRHGLGLLTEVGCCSSTVLWGLNVYFFPRRLRMSVSYYDAGVNVPTFRPAARAHEQDTHQAPPRRGRGGVAKTTHRSWRS